MSEEDGKDWWQEAEEGRDSQVQQPEYSSVKDKLLDDMQARIEELEAKLEETFDEYNGTGHLSTRLCLQVGIMLSPMEK